MSKGFPRNFLWGTATSAHQVEGNNIHNDWWAWEQEKEDITHSGEAANQYHLFQEDFELAKQLGQNAHRLSLEWSRLEPRAGEFSKTETLHYRNVLQALKKRGFSVMLTLHHFTLPLWFARRGGFLQAEGVKLFLRFVEYVVKKFSDFVDFWITINEPNIYAANGYLTGKWPPGKESLILYARVLRKIAQAHLKAYQKIHALLPEARVGIAKNYIFLEPAQNSLDKIVCSFGNKFWNESFYKKTKGSHDFLGINYYFHGRIQAKLRPPFFEMRNLDEHVTDLMWEIYPEGLYQILLELTKHKLPIYITENGLADQKDEKRKKFITDHLDALKRAIAQGIDVRGYFHWSLIDNFEWAHGFGPRFGLVEIDYQTQKRIPRKSAYHYQNLIQEYSN